MANQPPNSFDQSGQTINGPQTNIAGDVIQLGGLFNTGTIHGDVIIPAPQPSRAVAPIPPSDFVGHQEQLIQLTNLLTTDKATYVIALQGMGGIGKTALAQQLAAQLSWHFSGGVFWSGLAEHHGNAETILRTWGALCGADLTQEPNPAVLSHRVRGLLTTRFKEEGPILVILDDVRNDWLATAQLLQNSLPEGALLLLTIRDIELSVAFNADVIQLDVLSEESAHQLLVARVKSKELLAPEATVKTLLKHLGYLPLAIRLAAGYLSRFKCKPGFGLSRFVEDIAQKAVDLLDAPGGSGLSATFSISYDTLTRTQQQIFRYCSVYSPALLTVEYMSGLLRMDQSEVETALDELVIAALLEWDRTVPGRYVLHPLLQQYASDRLQELDNVFQIHQQAAQHLSDLRKVRVTTILEHLEEVDQWEKAHKWAMMVQRATALVEDGNHVGYWKEIKQRLLRALNVSERVESSEAVVANLYDAIGSHLQMTGELQTARTYCEDALTIRQKCFGEEHPDVACSFNNLGTLLQLGGEQQAARVCYERALATRQRLLGEQHLDTAHSLNSLATLLQHLGDFKTARDYYESALSVYRNQVGEQHPDTACILNNLGELLRLTQEWSLAKAHIELALEIFTTTIGSQHPRTAQSLNSMGILLYDMQKYEDACSYFQRALSIYERDDGFGEQHPDTVLFLSNMAATLQVLGKYEEAHHYSDRAATIRNTISIMCTPIQ